MWGKRVFGTRRDEPGDAGLGDREKDSLWFENRNPWGGKGKIMADAKEAKRQAHNKVRRGFFGGKKLPANAEVAGNRKGTMIYVSGNCHRCGNPTKSEDPTEFHLFVYVKESGAAFVYLRCANEKECQRRSNANGKPQRRERLSEGNWVGPSEKSHSMAFLGVSNPEGMWVMVVHILYVSERERNEPNPEIHKTEIPVRPQEMFMTPPGMYVMAIQVVNE
jgi:hypothetical protein